MNSVCLGCKYEEQFEAEMDEEERTEAEFFEAVEKDPDTYALGCC
jgi:hypothetical protein